MEWRKNCILQQSGANILQHRGTAYFTSTTCTRYICSKSPVKQVCSVLIPSEGARQIAPSLCACSPGREGKTYKAAPAEQGQLS